MKIDMTVRTAQPATATIGSGGRVDITTGAARRESAGSPQGRCWTCM